MLDKRVFIYSFIYLFIHLFIYLFIYLSIHLFIFSFIYLFIYLFIFKLMLSVILRSALNTLKCLALSVQYTCLAPCQDSTKWKDIGEEIKTNFRRAGGKSNEYRKQQVNHHPDRCLQCFFHP